ncbi:uncharacterized protein DMAD_09358 [Drosophila madeirensis]|uniref:Uncharacterized protein n=1 Tax=Drosophila madeirensis TaxID=30013 RepID=A0AAU9F7C4_DROMD
MSDNLKKLGEMKDVQKSANQATASSPVPKMKEEVDDPKCKVCKESLKESAEVMKTLPGMWGGNKVSGACAFCLFGLRS